MSESSGVYTVNRITRENHIIDKRTKFKPSISIKEFDTSVKILKSAELAIDLKESESKGY